MYCKRFSFEEILHLFINFPTPCVRCFFYSLIHIYNFSFPHFHIFYSSFQLYIPFLFYFSFFSPMYPSFFFSIFSLLLKFHYSNDSFFVLFYSFSFTTSFLNHTASVCFLLYVISCLYFVFLNIFHYLSVYFFTIVIPSIIIPSFRLHITWYVEMYVHLK